MDRKNVGSGDKGEGGRPQLSPVIGMALFLAPALGPTLGGYLVGYAGWQSIFLINVPIGIASAIFVWHYASEMAENKSDNSLRFDTIGSTLLSLGLLLAIYGASEGPLLGWVSLDTFPFLVAGIALIGIYVIWALRRANPAVNLKLATNPQTALALVISIIASLVLFAVLFLIPVFMESFQRVSSLDAGLVLLPQGLATGMGTVVGDKLSKKQGIHRTVIFGMAILAAGSAAMLAVVIQTPAWIIAPILSARGLALGLTIQPLLLSTIGRLRGSDLSDGNTLFNVFERLSGTIGVSLLATFFQLREQYRIGQVLSRFGINFREIGSSVGQSGSSPLLSSLPPAIRAQLGNAAGFHDTIIVLTIVSFLGLMLVLFIKKRFQTERTNSTELSILTDRTR